MTRPKTPSIDMAEQGYDLGMHAVGCWFGSVWSDAEGFLAPQRRRVVERHCRAVVRMALGGDRHRGEALRKLDPATVELVAQQAGVQAGAERGPHVSALVKAVADAEREARVARHAAAEAKHDRNDPKEKTELTEADRAAVGPLGQHEALERLLKLDAGPLTGDAHALGLLTVMDRMETARGLPRHLKIYAVECPGTLIFGVPAPQLTTEPGARLESGVWIGYVSEIAKAAGYPVPDTAQKKMERGLLAWGGIQKGLADRLREDEKRLSPEAPPALRRVIAGAIRELDEDYIEAQNMARSAPVRRSAE